MDFSKLSQNNWIGIGGGLVAFIAGWLPWYGVGAFDGSGFESSGFWGIAGILLAFQAAAILLMTVTGAGDINIGKLNAEQVGMVLAALATLFILIRFLLGVDGFDIKWGAFVGLAGAIAAAAGSFLSAKDKGIGIPTADQFTGGPQTPPAPGGGGTTF